MLTETKVYLYGGINLYISWWSHGINLWICWGSHGNIFLICWWSALYDGTGLFRFFRSKQPTDLTWPVSRGSRFIIWLSVCIARVPVAGVVTGIRCSSSGSSGRSCRRLHWGLCRWRPTGGSPVSCRPARHLRLTLGSSPVNTTVL